MVRSVFQQFRALFGRPSFLRTGRCPCGGSLSPSSFCSPLRLGRLRRRPFFVQVGPLAPMLHCMIETLVIVAVAALVVAAFMVFVGWTAS